MNRTANKLPKDLHAACAIKAMDQMKILMLEDDSNAWEWLNI
jgi:hypothetical protein